jgi:hypothetical protein
MEKDRIKQRGRLASGIESNGWMEKMSTMTIDIMSPATERNQRNGGRGLHLYVASYPSQIGLPNLPSPHMNT